MRFIFSFFVFSLFIHFPVFSQSIRAEMTATEKQILIGDVIHLQLTVNYAPDYVVEVGNFQDSAQKFEVIQHSKPIKGTQGKQNRWDESYQLTCFDSGTWIIPPIKVKYQKKGENTWQSVETQSIPVLVQTVSVDTTQEIKPIKAPLETAFEWKEAIPYAIVAFAILVIIATIFFFIRRKKKQAKPAAPPAPPRLLRDIVQEKLANLAEKQIWQSGNYKLYYTELTDILRFYVEKRYYISTFEATSDDILMKLESKIEKHHLYSLQGILQTADLVKFAKLVPENENHDYQMELAKKWITATANDLMIVS